MREFSGAGDLWLRKEQSRWSLAQKDLRHGWQTVCFEVQARQLIHRLAKKCRQLWHPAKRSKAEIRGERDQCCMAARLLSQTAEVDEMAGWLSGERERDGSTRPGDAPAEEASEWQSRGQTERETHNLGTLVDWLCRFDKKNNLDGVVDSRVGAGRKVCEGLIRGREPQEIQRGERRQEEGGSGTANQEGRWLLPFLLGEGRLSNRQGPRLGFVGF